MAEKKRVQKEEFSGMKIPSPPRLHKVMSHFLVRRVGVWVVILVIAILISGLAFIMISNAKEKGELERKMLGYEKVINGTQIQAAKDTIQKIVASGTPPVTKDEALSGTGKDYICTLTTDEGIMTLKKRGSLMREEVMRSGFNLSVIFLEDNMYMYHPQYYVWAMFPYNPDDAISKDVNTKSAFSLGELKAMNETQYLCIKTTLPENEFSLGDTRIVDALKFLRDIRFLR